MAQHLHFERSKPNVWRPLLATAGLVLAGLVDAQVSLYTFEQSQQTWTEITAADGGYQLGTPVFNPPNSEITCYVDPANLNGTENFGAYINPISGPGFPIGFPFEYNSDVFDRIGISNMGWIGFGKSEDGNDAVEIYVSDHPGGRPLSYDVFPIEPAYQRNRVVGFGTAALRQQDMSSINGPVSSFRVATIGTAPNRVCVIQWARFRSNYSSNDASISFQIRLNEVDNSVDVRMGPMLWGYAGSGAVQIGLGGQSSSDFNSRMTVYEEPTFNHDWNTTVATTINTGACIANNPADSQINGPGVYPTVGLNFKWTPTTCPPPAWPLVLSDVTFNSAIASWPPAGDANDYDYVVTTLDDPTAPPVASGNTEEVSILIDGLEPLTTYYLFVRSNCSGGPGIWGTATPILTQGGADIICGDPAIPQTHCSSQYTTVTWRYSTSDGTSPVRAVFSAGVAAGVLTVYDGPDESGLQIFTSNGNGELTGQVLTANTGQMFMKLVTDAGSCESQPWFLPWEWTVGCLDCSSPLGTFSIVNEDCDLLQYEMQVLVVDLGSSSSVIISNSQGIAPTTITETGTYTVGPFTANVPVVITLENPDNDLCDRESTEYVNAPCAVVDCGPTDYTYCYADNASAQWLYQGDELPIGIRWRRGSTFGSDVTKTYQGSDPFAVQPVTQPADLANVLVTSANVENVLLLEIDADASVSCQDGYAVPWDYVVACYDGCTQPTASFTVVPDCASQQFSIAVQLTTVGSAGSVSITNNGGAPVVTATAAGSYTVGPFASLTPVYVEVVGASELCSWSSPLLTYDCVVGITEQQDHLLTMYPNPNEGLFRMDLPEELDGLLEMRVTDLQGRVVSLRSINGNGARVMDLDLGALRSGAYVIALSNATRTFTGKVQILH